MRQKLWAALVAALLSGWARPCPADPFLRYALIVGVNQGHTEVGAVKLDPLHHAEEEAAALRNALVTTGGFPATGDRVLLLRGEGRTEILAAAARLASQHRQDRMRFGNVRTMFAFFFTGHGLENKLLTSDDPLTGADIARIFKQVGATFSLGMFDACFSGSLDFTAMRAKGLRPPRGFDAFGQLPYEMLNAEGTMWLVSSMPDQLSYEDDRLGSVFTHFFIEGMEQARADDFGVSLESVWEYASRQTQQYTVAVGRPQTPQKLVRELTATGPIYLGYARPRSAQLTFAPEMGGQFLMRYETGELSEILHKVRGKELRVAVFPGALWIEAEGQGPPRRQRLHLAAGDHVQLYESTGWRPRAGLGREEMRIAAKGDETPDFLVAREVPRLSVLFDMTYRLVQRPQNASVPLHGAALGGLLERGWLVLRLGGEASWSSERFDTWESSVRRLAGEVGVGLARNLGPLHLIGTVDGRLANTRVEYDEGTRRSSYHFGTGASLSTLVPLGHQTAPIFLDVRVGLLAEPVTSLAYGSESKWTVMPFIGLGLAGRAW